QMVAATGNDLPLPHWRRRASSARALAEEVVERGEARHRLERYARHRDRLRDTRHAIAVRILEAEAQRRLHRLGVAGGSPLRVTAGDRASGRLALGPGESQERHGVPGDG